jgi:hypothetical protein
LLRDAAGAPGISPDGLKEMFMITFKACKVHVANRGSVPDEFLRELVAWGQSAPDEIFIARPGHEIYSDVADELGPYPATGIYRRAVMLEVLRVLGGFESSWKWNAGVDSTNPDSNTPCTEEAGAFQCSGNSMNFDPSLKTLVRQVAGSEDCNIFQQVTKWNHSFAIEYCARLLRFTTQHHGPIKHHKIHEWLSRDAVQELEAAMAEQS